MSLEEYHARQRVNAMENRERERTIPVAEIHSWQCPTVLLTWNGMHHRCRYARGHFGECGSDSVYYERAVAQVEVERLRKALEDIALGDCEGAGPDGDETVRCGPLCAPCIARRALEGSASEVESPK